MKKKISPLPFNGTPEQEAQLLQIIAENKQDPSMLMGVMQKAQDIYGYLPIEVQKIIADGMGVPLEKVYGVATFYAQFSLEPKGDYIISVCTGTACYVKGAQAILDKIEAILGITDGQTSADGLFTIQNARCIGCCGLAPAMTINEHVYGKVTPDQIPAILESYRK